MVLFLFLLQFSRFGPHSRHNIDSQATRLRHNTLHNTLKGCAAQSRLRVLDLRNLPHMLQADFANRSLVGVARCCAVVEGCLAFGVAAQFAVRPCYISSATDLVLRGFDASCGEEKLCGGRRADLEVEAAIGTDGDTRRDGCAGDVVCCAGVEFLESNYVRDLFSCDGLSKTGVCTLQKSIDFTPLLPSAGPTGGEGDAWPAPTMSLTIWSFASAFFAMVFAGNVGYRSLSHATRYEGRGFLTRSPEVCQVT